MNRRRALQRVRTQLLCAALALSACATPAANTTSSADAAREQIYVLRSIREPHEPVAGWCAAAKTGFAPYAADAERKFSFWSVRTDAADGRVVDAAAARVAELRGCFGPADQPARQNFYAEIKLDGLAFEGRGECLALAIDTPQPGMYPVRCQLVLSALPAPYVGGVLTTNTLTSSAAFGPRTDPPGYAQASIAVIRLWRAGP